MTLATVFLVAIALGTDALSMALSIGLNGIRWKNILLISGTICIFHILMPLIGLYIGSILGNYVGRFAAYIGAFVLVYIGIQMIRGSMGKDKERKEAKVCTGGFALCILAGSVSMDALTVGFGLGTLEVNLLLTVLIMGIVAGLMTAIGFVLGRKLGPWLGVKAQLLGGIILILIGIKMLF
jgi:putative Mn2+ efflux pump MntP